MINKTTLEKLKLKFNNHYYGNYSFRLLSKSDVFPLFTATDNPEFNSNLLWSKPEKFENLTPEVEKLIKETTLNQSISVSVCDKDSATWQALLKLTPFLDGIIITLWVHPNFWNTRAAFVAIEAAINLSFISEIPVVYARTKHDYVKMHAIINKKGGEFYSEDVLVHQDGHNLKFHTFYLPKEKWNPSVQFNPY